MIWILMLYSSANVILVVYKHDRISNYGSDLGTTMNANIVTTPTTDTTSDTGMYVF